MLREALEDWYRREARALPWRADRDAYRVWVSEALLQQTRVETVIGRYGSFLAALPTLRSLAAASEAEVLALWSGLGYYSRARKLREAARQIVERHGGEFPRERAAALALPGVGPYTAGAVLSIAYGLPEPLVDGNVERVFCRYYALAGDPKKGPLKSELWRRARELVLEAEPGAWNQALMELGATVCTPSSPRCDACPVAAGCQARSEGRVLELPERGPRREPVDVRLEVLLVQRGGGVLVEELPAGGRLAGLVQLPTRELPGPDGGLSGLFPSSWGAALHGGAELTELSHGITHHRIRARVRSGRLAGEPLSGPFRWVRAQELEGLGITGMTRKVLRAGFILGHDSGPELMTRDGRTDRLRAGSDRD